MSRNFQPSWSGANGRAWAQSRLVNTLRQAAGGWVAMGELIDSLYGSAAGPSNANGAVRCLVRRLREDGWPIASANGRGYRYAPELVRQTAVGD